MTGIENRLSYANARIDISHDYSGAKAEISTGLAGAFIEDAIKLLERLENPDGMIDIKNSDRRLLLDLIKRIFAGYDSLGFRVEDNRKIDRAFRP